MTKRRVHISAVIAYAICLHALWAALLITDQSVKKITAIASLTQYVTYPWGAALFFTVAALACVGLFAQGRRVRLLLLLPQQAILFLSAGGAMEAIWVSHFPDGYVASRAFIAADQFPAILVAIAHTWAILQQVRTR